jgi:hypothetical protein
MGSDAAAAGLIPSLRVRLALVSISSLLFIQNYEPGWFASTYAPGFRCEFNFGEPDG